MYAFDGDRVNEASKLSMQTVRLPAHNSATATVRSVRVRVGEYIVANQTLLDIEMDKAVIEAPSPRSGVVTKIHICAGQRLEPEAYLVDLCDRWRDLGERTN